MSSEESHKWALITGVSENGLGDALTQELLSRNINVIVTAPAIHNLDYLPWHDGLAKVQLDVTSALSIRAAVAEVTKITHGSLDILINNAGYGYMMPLLDADAHAVVANFDVNVFGLLSVTQAFFPLLRHAHGMVVNQCSIASLSAGRQPFIGTYCATKAAVASLSDTMRVEFASFGVKVSLPRRPTSRQHPLIFLAGCVLDDRRRNNTLLEIRSQYRLAWHTRMVSLHAHQSPCRGYDARRD
jgi:1-acylglycerone phosphate reductase